MRISDWSSDVCSSDLEAPPGIGILYRRTFKRLDKADQRRQRGAKFMACVGDEIDAHLFGRAQGRAIDDAYRLLVVSDGVGKQFPPLILSAQIEEFGSGAGGRALRQQRRRRRVEIGRAHV